ncbi:MAG: T9SS type A sorting domain-containing protein, partial [Candidatus Krumholzibacteria bacterium]|nr:T9SS type A sorting domain-containing protein [Candidatus Krumholzibacteria bacterium]
VGGITPLFSTVGLDVRYPYAYLAVGPPGMFIIDVSNPVAPVQMGFYDSSNARDVAIAPDGIHAFLADGAGGVRIINVSDPSDPHDIGQISTVDYAREIFIHNGFAYLAAEEDGLRVIDISSPASAFETGYYDTADHANGVMPGGTRVFVADHYAGLWILDNTQATPVLLALFDLRAEAGRMNLRWELGDANTVVDFRLTRHHAGRIIKLDWRELDPGVYEAIDTDAGLREGGYFEYRLYGRETGEMWQLLRSKRVELEPAPLKSRIEGAWPNPFNPGTNIRFTLEEPGPASLTIIDVNGALVIKLHDGSLPAGEHERVWDGLDARGVEVGSGVYFVHFIAAKARGSLKLVLIR